MSSDYSEKREYYRMNMNCTVEYSVNGSGKTQSALLKNLSGDGVMIELDHRVEPGTEIKLSINPEQSVTSPLNVTVEVLRCEESESDQFTVAGNITKR